MRYPALALSVFMLASAAFAADKPAPVPTFADRQQPIFKLMHVEEAWKITRGGPGCVVGVIDSGFDFFHPALQANLKPGWFAPGVYHTDFFSMDAHGTQTASIIAAKRIEGQDGMQGLAPDCAVLTAAQGMPMHKYFRLYREYFSRKDPTMDGFKKEMAAHQDELKAWGDVWLEYVFGSASEAIRYLADHNVRVINMSEFISTSALANKPELKARVEAAFAYEKQKDVLIVLASGNSDNRITEYPGDADFVMVAGASTLADQRWSMTVDMNGSKIPQGSCYGPRLSVLAPVENIVAANPHEEAYYSWKDTPMGVLATSNRKPPLRISYSFALLAILGSPDEG
jgi:subtilisin family serine protease